MNINQLVRSKGYKKFMAKLYGIGAAVVILGALFKINHYPGADLMLLLGMGTECIIFFFSAFEPLHVEYDWSLVYPELSGMEGHMPTKRSPQIQNDALSQKLDALLVEAKIGPELFDSLGQGLRDLAATTKSLSVSSDVMKANNAYVEELNKLTQNLNKINDVYSEQVQVANQQITIASQAQGNLQKMIEAQTEKALQMQENLQVIINNISGTLENSEKYKKEVSSLSDKVSSLNNIYGNMLSAMNIK